MIRCGLADDHDYRTPDFQNQILYILCIDVNNSCNSRGGGAAPLRLDCGLRPGPVQAEHGLHPTPQRRGNPCGCPVIPGLGAHKGRPYGCVQDDDSDQTNITPG